MKVYKTIRKQIMRVLFMFIVVWGTNQLAFSQSEITIYMPEAGDVLYRGKSTVINWVSPTGTVDEVTVDLYRNGLLWDTNIASGTSTYLTWDISPTRAVDNTYHIRVKEVGGTAYEESGTFSIIDAYLEFDPGYDNTTVEVDQGFAFTWDHNLTEGQFELEYSTGSGSGTIATLDHSATSYGWNPPDNLAGETASISISNPSYPGLGDVITGINLVDYYVSVSAPSGGQEYRDGDPVTINWTTHGYDSEYGVDIVLFKDGDADQELYGDTNDDGSASWTVDAATASAAGSSSFYIKVYELVQPGVRGPESDISGSFTLKKNQLNFITSGPITQPAGTDITLNWSDNLPGTLQLHYEDAGGNWAFIETVGSAETSYDWSTPYGADYISSTRVRIRSTEYPAMTDYVNNISLTKNITVDEPAPGDTLFIGEYSLIHYIADYPAIEHVGIDLYHNESSFYRNIVHHTPNGSYYDQWTAEEDFPTTGTYYIEVYEMIYNSGSYSRGTASATSGNFYIKEPEPEPKYLNFASDYDSAQLTPGQIFTIDWEHNFDEGSFILEYKYNGSWRTIDDFVGVFQSSYGWYVPGWLIGTIRIRIRLSGGYSDEAGRIKVGDFTLNSPAAGQAFRDGDVVTINWTPHNDSNYVNLSLYEEGSFYKTITGQTLNDGSYSWTVSPEEASSGGSYYTIEIVDLREPDIQLNGYVSDQSEQFHLENNHLAFDPGYDGLEITAGYPFTVTWSHNLEQGQLKLEFQQNGIWHDLETVDRSDTSYTWNTPDWTGPTALRISSTHYPALDNVIDNLMLVPLVTAVTEKIAISSPSVAGHYNAGSVLPIKFATNVSSVDINLVGPDEVIPIQSGFEVPDPDLNVINSVDWNIPVDLPAGGYTLKISSGTDVVSVASFGIGPGEVQRTVTYNDYNSIGNVLQSTDASGHEAQYFYGTNTQPLTQSSTGINGALKVYLTGIRQVNNSGTDLETTANYNPEGLVSTVTDPNGNQTFYLYDGFSRLDTVKNSQQDVVADYFYKYPGTAFSATNPNWIRTLQYTGSTTRTSKTFFDGLGRSIQSQRQDGSDFIVAAQTYDAAGREHESWKPYRWPTGDSYDDSFSANAQGSYGNSYPYVELQYEASPLGRPVKMIPEGGETAGSSVQTGYDVRTWENQPYMVTMTTDESGNATETWTDGWGRTVRTVADPGGINAETEFTYDELDNLTKVTAPNNTGTAYSYNTRGELTMKASDDADTTRYIYDAAGNLRFSQDANQAAADSLTWHRYDFAGRLIRTGVGALPAATGFTDLDPGTVYSFENDNTIVEVNAYDEMPSTAEYPWDQFSTQLNTATVTNTKGQLAAQAWRFGGNGVPGTASLWGYGITGQEQYQAADSITAGNTIVDPGASLILEAGGRIRLKDGFTAVQGSEFSASIDPGLAGAASQGISSVAGDNPWQVTLFSYDTEGRVADKWIYTGNRSEWDTHLAYRYNRQGEVTRMKVRVGSDSLYQHYSYNQRGLLDSVWVSTDGIIDAETPEVAYTYTATGAVENIDFKGGKDANYGYTIRDWVDTINNVASPGGNFAANYNYADNGNISKAQFYNPDIDLTDPAHKHYHQTFTYDALNRLTGANYGYGAGSGSSFFDVTGITYDKAGNIESLQRDKETGALIDNLSYNYSGDSGSGVFHSNRLQSVTDAVSGTAELWDAEDATFGYDPNGNLTSQRDRKSVV